MHFTTHHAKLAWSSMIPSHPTPSPLVAGVLWLAAALLGCEAPPGPASVDPSPTSEAAQRATREWLAKRHFTSRGGPVFCAIEVLGSRANAPGTFDLFVWAYCAELVRDAGALEQGSGSSVPCTVGLVLDPGGWRATHVTYPEDGAGHDASLRAMFPLTVHARLRLGAKDRTELRDRVHAEAARTP